MSKGLLRALENDVKTRMDLFSYEFFQLILVIYANNLEQGSIEKEIASKYLLRPEQLHTHGYFPLLTEYCSEISLNHLQKNRRDILSEEDLQKEARWSLRHLIACFPLEMQKTVTFKIK